MEEQAEVVEGRRDGSRVMVEFDDIPPEILLQVHHVRFSSALSTQNSISSNICFHFISHSPLLHPGEDSLPRLLSGAASHNQAIAVHTVTGEAFTMFKKEYAIVGLHSVAKN